MFLACHENFLSLIDWELFQVELCLGFIIRRVKDDMVLLVTDRESELVKDNIPWFRCSFKMLSRASGRASRNRFRRFKR